MDFININALDILSAFFLHIIFPHVQNFILLYKFIDCIKIYLFSDYFVCEKKYNA